MERHPITMTTETGKALQPNTQTPTRTRFASMGLLLCRIVLGFAFILSAIPKLLMPYAFLSNVFGFELLGPNAGLLLAIVLPWLEIVLAVLLLADVFAVEAILVSAALAALFTFAQASAIHRGLEISCGCFSQVDPGQVSYVTLGKACLLGLVAALGVCFSFLGTAWGKRPQSSKFTEIEVGDL